MLKKLVSILLIPIVLVCSTGAVIFKEYCPMGKEVSYSLSDEKSCCCSSQSIHTTCCDQTKIVIEKIKDDHSRTTSCHVPAVKFSEFIFLSVPTPLISDRIALCSIYTNDHAPPEIQVSIPILFRSLLI